MVNMLKKLNVHIFRADLQYEKNSLTVLDIHPFYISVFIKNAIKSH